MATEALIMTKIVEIINKKEFAIAALNTNNETFIIYRATLAKPTTMLIHFFCRV